MIPTVYIPETACIVQTPEPILREREEGAFQRDASQSLTVQILLI